MKVSTSRKSIFRAGTFLLFAAIAISFPVAARTTRSDGLDFLIVGTSVTFPKVVHQEL